MGCVNTAIQRRDALRLGVDVAEADTWGMDCYTRRNIQDGGPPRLWMAREISGFEGCFQQSGVHNLGFRHTIAYLGSQNDKQTEE